MANQVGAKAYNTFIKGIITEASVLTFPENASVDEENFILNKDGSRHRRLGMDIEPSGVEVSTGKTANLMDNYLINSYRWDNVGSDITRSFGVFQIGPDLWFVDLYESILSANIKNNGVALTVGGNGQKYYQFATANGDLIVSTGEGVPKKLVYNATTDSFTVSDIVIQIRDTFGVDDGLALDEKPPTLSKVHNYNLLNQGWSQAHTNSYFSSTNTYPSNTQTWHSGKDSNDDFSPSLLDKQAFGNTPAATGHYIIDAFTRGISRTAGSSVTELPTDTSSGKINAVATHSSRIFYSGILDTVIDGDAKSPNYTGYVFFSKTLINNNSINECYQAGDPTSEYESDLVDTDGGTIPLPDTSNILKMISTKEHLIIIAENGVWQIYGGDRGFLATEYQVSKITDVGAVGANAVVEAGDVVFYWSKGGMYVLAPDQVSGNFTATNITETTIQSLYDDIASVARANATGIYDPTSKRITWLYNDSAAYDGVTDNNFYDTELIYDTVLDAFYKNTISKVSGTTPHVAALISTPNFVKAAATQNVVVNGEQVQVNGEDVVVTSDVRSRGSSTTKYLTITPSDNAYYSFTFSAYTNTNFIEWESFDSVGADYSSYLITGHELYGDMLRDKHVPYLFTFFNRTETGYTGSGNDLALAGASSCFVQARWEWTDSAASGRWGTPFQAYRLKRHFIPADATDTFDYGYSTVDTKSRLRGKGKALSLKFYSEAGKDAHILGWGTTISMTTVP